MLNRIFDYFFDDLFRRFSGGICTTEDSVRYVFLNSILRCTELNSDSYILDYKPQEMPNCEIDLFIPPVIWIWSCC